MKENNKGVTLVELLAIMVVISFILFMVTPEVLKSIKNSKKSSAIASTKGLAEAAYVYVEKVMLDNAKAFPKDTVVFNFDGEKFKITDESALLFDGFYYDKVLDYNGIKAKGGTITISNAGKNIDIDNLQINEFLCNYGGSDAKCFDNEYVQNNTYTVTFDVDGGTLDTNTKQVVYGMNYGNLPIPKKSGYKFMGWNGKNKVDLSSVINSSFIDNGDGTYSMWKNDSGRFSEFINISIPRNTPFTISYNLLEYNGTYRMPLQFNFKLSDNSWNTYSNNTSSTGGSYNTDNDIVGFKLYQENAMPINTYVRFDNFMFEFSSQATPYEPYYVTSNVEVTQNKNHTLKAIWQSIS